MRAWIARRTGSDLHDGICWPRTAKGRASLLLMLFAVVAISVGVVVLGGMALGELRSGSSQGLAASTAQAVLVALCLAGLAAVAWALANAAVALIIQPLLAATTGRRRQQTD